MIERKFKRLTRADFSDINGRDEMKRCLSFVLDNKEYVWRFFVPLLPLVFLIIGFQIVIQLWDAQMIKGMASVILSFLSSYVFICYAYSWHRAFLKGKFDEAFVNPFKLTEEQKGFVWLWAKVILVIFLVSIVYMVFAIILGQFVIPQAPLVAIPMVIITIAYIAFLMIYITRVMFCLPGKAIGENLTLKDGDDLSQGLLLKFFGSSWSFFWRVILPVALVLGIVIFLLQFVPFAAFIQPVVELVFNVFMITVSTVLLSRYYEIAIEKQKSSV